MAGDGTGPNPPKLIAPEGGFKVTFESKDHPTFTKQIRSVWAWKDYNGDTVYELIE